MCNTDRVAGVAGGSGSTRTGNGVGCSRGAQRVRSDTPRNAKVRCWQTHACMHTHTRTMHLSTCCFPVTDESKRTAAHTHAIPTTQASRRLFFCTGSSTHRTRKRRRQNKGLRTQASIVHTNTLEQPIPLQTSVRPTLASSHSAHVARLHEQLSGVHSCTALTILPNGGCMRRRCCCHCSDWQQFGTRAPTLTDNMRTQPLGGLRRSQCRR